MVILLFSISFLLSYKQNDSVEKLSAYECGFEPFDASQSKVDIQFFFIAILFLLFDLEIVFFFPLVQSLYYIPIFSLINIFIFFFFIIFGLVVECEFKATFLFR